VVPEDFSQPDDFRDESAALYALLAGRPVSDLGLVTQFKEWSIEDVIAHLHLFNQAADLSLRDPAGLTELFASLNRVRASGQTLCEATNQQLGGLSGRDLLEAWRSQCDLLAEQFEGAHPRQRVPWAGPDMSARSSISARLMETWAHGQAIYDQLGVVRVDTDRIRNIAVLGVNTFAWTYRNRGLDVPTPTPRVRLEAPSGTWWEWNDDVETDLVEGAASEFCQLVTQTRALADTSLRVEGDVARGWMSIAQCFAGPPEEPPKPGTRHLVTAG
jgi:uncharacterized protein (TIGR03084 family)